MDATTELATWPETDHANLVSILLSEECNCTKFLGFFKRSVAVFIKREVLTDHLIDEFLYLTKLFIGYFLEVRKVKSQRSRVNIRAFLLHMVAQNLLQRIVKQVGCRVIGSASIAFLHVYTSHEFSLKIFRKLLNDVDALVVFALRINDFDGLILADKCALIANLTAHFTIERRVVEYNLVESILFLGHFSIAKNVASVLRVVVTNEYLLSFSYHFPVSILYNSCVSSTSFLLSHFFIEAFLIYCVTVFAANEFG